MALEKSATTRSSPTATRPTKAPSRDTGATAGADRSEGPSPGADTDRDSAPKSAVLEPEDRVTLSESGDDFDPDRMGNLARSLRAQESAAKPDGDQAVDKPESIPETDSVLNPISENFDEEIAAYAEQQKALAQTAPGRE